MIYHHFVKPLIKALLFRLKSNESPNWYGKFVSIFIWFWVLIIIYKLSHLVLCLLDLIGINR